MATWLIEYLQNLVRELAKLPIQFSGVEYIRIGMNKKNLEEYLNKEREL